MLIVNVIITPNFFKISINNGVLYGFIIDILNRSSSLVILSLGMTFVIATSGIDISVGSLVAMDCMILAVGMEYNEISPTLLVPFVLLIGIVFGAAATRATPCSPPWPSSSAFWAAWPAAPSTVFWWPASTYSPWWPR